MILSEDVWVIWDAHNNCIWKTHPKGATMMYFKEETATKACIRYNKWYIRRSIRTPLRIMKVLLHECS